MPSLNFSMLDQSSIVMHIVQRNRFMMLTIFKKLRWKIWRVEMYSSSSKVYLNTVLVRIGQTPYKQRRVRRRDRWFCTAYVSVHLEDEACLLFIIMWHMIVFFSVVFPSHMWLSGHLVLFLLFLLFYDFSFNVAFTFQFSHTRRPS